MTSLRVPTLLALSLSQLAWTPTSIGFVDSGEHPIRCHYEYADSEPDCDTVLGVMDAAWAHQIEELGWEPPAQDDGGRLGVYLTDDGTGGDAYADCIERVDHTVGDGRSGCVAYIALDYRAGPEAWWNYGAHEFNHVLQYATDFQETAEILWEGAACAIDLWQPEPQPVWVTDTRDFQAHPWVGLLGDGRWLWREHQAGEFYEYGGVAWWLHLDATHGDGTGRIAAQLWDAIAQEGLPNEPDILEGYDAVTGDWRGSLLAFSEERARMGTADHPAWADYTLSEPQVDVSIGLTTVLGLSDLPAVVTPVHMPYETGAVYLSLEGLDAGTRVSLVLEGDPGVSWGVVAVDGASGTGLEGDALAWESQGGTLILAAVNLGRPDIDADPDPEGRESFPGTLEAWDVTLHVSLVEQADTGDPEPDTGGETGDPPEGCGCGTARGAASLLAWVALLSAVLRRRAAPPVVKPPGRTAGCASRR
jgi:uncharacterized protein (TIGR03382 family)